MKDEPNPRRVRGQRHAQHGCSPGLPEGVREERREPLDRNRLEGVEHAIEAEPLGDLAGRYEGTVGEGEPNVLWLQVARGGTVRTVSVVGDRRVPELERLTARLTDAFR